MTKPNEKWLPVVGHESAYAVSDKGRVWSHRSGVYLKPGLSSNGYLTVCLQEQGRRKSYCVQYLVAAAFINARPKGYMVLHKDDDKRNNTVDNLYYGTSSDNQHDRTRNQRARKFSHTQIRQIRALRATGMGIVELGKRFNTPHNHISYICRRKQYDTVN